MPLARVGLGAVRAREAAALCEIDLAVETTGLGIEVGRLDHRRRDEAESELQKVGVAHIGTWGWSILPTSGPPLRSALKDKPHLKEDGRALSSASLTAARPVGVSLCHEDQSALRPFTRVRSHPLDPARRLFMLPNGYLPSVRWHCHYAIGK